MTTPTLFDLPVVAPACRTCGGAGDPGPLPLEPVSGECLACNHATVHQILYGPDRDTAWRRHFGHDPRLTARLRRGRAGTTNEETR